MKNDDFRGPFGRAPVMVLVIFKVALGRQLGRLGRPLWAPKIHCEGNGVNKETRKEVIAQDLTRAGPMARRICNH